MNPRRIHVIVEGETERDFVNDHLAPSFRHHDTIIDARLLGTSGHKGGNVKWQRLLGDIQRTLLSDRSAYTTTFFDYFRMSTDFPGEPHRTTGDTAAKKEAVEKSMVEGLTGAGFSSDSLRRFIPYVQLHEYEALLFSDPHALARGIYQQQKAPVLAAIRAQYRTPEDINDDSQLAPSKRLAQECRGYRKTIYGALAALEVGLPAMRRECPHFNDWLSRLESLMPLPTHHAGGSPS